MKKVGDAIKHESVGVFFTTSVRLSAVIATQLALTEGVSNSLKFVPIVGQVGHCHCCPMSIPIVLYFHWNYFPLFFITIVGQVLGSVVGAGVSGSMSYHTLKKMLNAHKVISETSLKVLSAMQTTGVRQSCPF